MPASRAELSTGSCADGEPDDEAVTLHSARVLWKGITMTSMTAARRRLTAAGDLPNVLRAAYDAFEYLLMIFQVSDDPADCMFAPFVISAALAADGRDAMGFVPSLAPGGMGERNAAMADGEQASASELAALCRDLVTSVEPVGETGSNPDGRAACRDAVKCARGIHLLLTGGEP